MNRHLSIAVAIPSTEMWHAPFGLRLAEMCAYFGMNRLPGAASQRLHIISSRGSMLSQLRENLVLSAIKVNADFIMFLDSDMKFPKDIIHRLIKHDLDFVAANATTKTIPAEPIAILPNGRRLYTDPNSTGLVQVKQIGVAVALLKTRLFKIRKNSMNGIISRPWFHMAWNEEIQHYMGEDVFFCRKLEEVKIPIFVDQDVSQEIGHVGTFTYDHSVVGSFENAESNAGKSKVA